MRFKFTEDKTYNPVGANHTRVQAKAGEEHDLPPYLCRMLSDWGHVVGAAPSEQPTAAPAEQKATYSLEERGAGWYGIVDEDGDTIDKIRGENNAIAKLKELNE